MKMIILMLILRENGFTIPTLCWWLLGIGIGLGAAGVILKIIAAFLDMK